MYLEKPELFLYGIAAKTSFWKLYIKEYTQ